jgi:hypothetical protein
MERRLAVTLSNGMRGDRYLKQPDSAAMKQSGNVVWCERGADILLDPVVVVRLPGVSCLSILGWWDTEA